MEISDNVDKGVIVYAHYDKDCLVDEYVIYYLEELKKFSCDIVFVTTSDICGEAYDALSQICAKIIKRPNIGYDFYSYKVGIESIEISNYGWLLICNDSVYGPFYPIVDIYEAMSSVECDFWGITQSSDIDYHLQSYFVFFKKKVINSASFRKFWDNVDVVSDKKEIINKYEVGLTQKMISAGFKPGCFVIMNPGIMDIVSFYTFRKLSFLRFIRIANKFFDAMKRCGSRAVGVVYAEKRNILIDKIERANQTHIYWRPIIVKHRMPFIKIELLRDNPAKVNINNYDKVIAKYTTYDVSMIKKHLARFV